LRKLYCAGANLINYFLHVNRRIAWQAGLLNSSSPECIVQQSAHGSVCVDQAYATF
jgi:hypothetical protein